MTSNQAAIDALKDCHAIFDKDGRQYVDQVFQEIISALQQQEASAWLSIKKYYGCSGVLVTRTPDKCFYGPYAAFMDVTGVWRVLGSEGGNCPLSFEPTHFQELPRPLRTKEQADD